MDVQAGRDYTVTEAGHTTPCWLWNHSLSDQGYGRVGRHDYAHRETYRDRHGDIPVGLVLDHLCRNRACVNPDHLEAVPHEENCRRGAKAKITAEQAREIRRLRSEGHSLRYLETKFGLHNSTLSRIANGKRWANA